MRWPVIGALTLQRVTVSGHSCQVLCRTGKRHSTLLVLVLLRLVLLELSRSQAVYTEHHARPGFVHCVSLAFHAGTRIFLRITGTRDVELFCRIQNAVDQWVICFTAAIRACIAS